MPVEAIVLNWFVLVVMTVLSTAHLVRVRVRVRNRARARARAGAGAGARARDGARVRARIRARPRARPRVRGPWLRHPSRWGNSSSNSLHQM